MVEDYMPKWKIIWWKWTPNTANSNANKWSKTFPAFCHSERRRWEKNMIKRIPYEWVVIFFHGISQLLRGLYTRVNNGCISKIIRRKSENGAMKKQKMWKKEEKKKMVKDFPSEDEMKEIIFGKMKRRWLCCFWFFSFLV